MSGKERPRKEAAEAGPVKRVRVVLVDDDVHLVHELERLLARVSEVSVVAAFHDAETALPYFRDVETPVDVALVDLGLPGMSGLELIGRIAALRPEVEKMVFTVSGDDDDVFAALEGGATGYLLKDTEVRKLVQGIVEVARGGSSMSPSIARRVLARLRASPTARPPKPDRTVPLTQREEEVLELLARGYTYAMIGTTLGIATGTVQAHIKAIYGKLEIGSKAEAAREAFRRGLVD